jgi:flagellar hook assembly protein FlgD
VDDALAAPQRTRRRPSTLLTLLLAFSVAFVAGLAPAPAGTARAATRLKAVVIVGPVGSLTSSYLADGVHIAAVAASYGMDVRQVLTPHATWANVLANIQGASIVVYLGHGNGWPSPYPPFTPARQDGLGLNATDGSTVVQYYGEGPVASYVHLAPNAVVLLEHLCYASGNSEPGLTPPTTAVAMQRVDDFGAGFLRAGAHAVFAYGISDVSTVIRDLMTTHRTMDQIFMGTGYIGGRDIRFPSLRTPGFDVHMDPASSTVYYRSVVGDLSMTADAVTGAPFARTDLIPATFVVPGKATVTGTVPAAVLDAPGGVSVGTLAPGSLVSLVAGPVTGTDTLSYFQVASPLAGFIPATSLTPADSTGPRAWGVQPWILAFSPNGDGTADTLPITMTWSESAQWTASISRLDGTLLRTWTGSGQTAAFTWDGYDGGAPLPDGHYRLSASATDANGNVGEPYADDVVIDTVAPVFGLTGDAAGALSSGAARAFSPNGDGWGDVLGVGVTTSEAGVVGLAVRDGTGTVVRHALLMVPAGATTVTWDGRDDSGATVPDGTYALELTPADQAGNRAPVTTTWALVLTSLRLLTASRSIFYAADGDALAPNTSLSATVVQPALVDWSIVDAGGAVKVAHWTAQSALPGTYAWTWDGRDASGAYVASGAYTVVISATTAAGTITYRRSIWVGPFQIVPSTSTLAAGRSVTVTIVSAEPLLSRPTLMVTQPGLASYILATTLVATGTYRVTFTPRTSAAGTVVLRAYGVDTYGHAQKAYLSMPKP